MIELTFADQYKEKMLVKYMRDNGQKWHARIFSSMEAAAIVHDHISVYISVRKLPYRAFRVSEIVNVIRVKTNEEENFTSSTANGN